MRTKAELAVMSCEELKDYEMNKVYLRCGRQGWLLKVTLKGYALIAANY